MNYKYKIKKVVHLKAPLGVWGLLFSLLWTMNGFSAGNSFVRMKNHQFYVNGKPCYYIGTNFWYGAILGSKGEGGNRERLIRELDF